LASPQEMAARLKEFFGLQEESYRRVLEFSRRQVASIEAGDTAGLMRILSDKQAVLRQVESLSREIEPLLTAWEEAKSALSPEERAAVEQAHASLKTVLTEVLQMEEEGRQRLADRTTDQGRKITEIQKGKQMLKAYGRPPKSGPARFTDNTK
jgi:hypothetical protein